MKKTLAMILCMGAILGIATGCKEPEPQPIPAEPSTWAQASEEKFIFPSYLIGYYDDDSAVSVGYNGEIHYLDAAAEEWPFAENDSLCRFGMDMVDESIIYTCGNGGHVTKSTDGGKTYARVTGFGGDSSDQCCMMSFCDENNGLIASVSQLAITSDGAQTWTELTVPSGIAAIRMESPEKFYYVGSDFNFYKTTDGGATWETTAMNLPMGAAYRTGAKDYTILYIDGENKYTVFCIEDESGTLKSYSTADGWLSYTENTIPEYTGLEKAYVYINRDGTIVTLTNAKAKRIIVLKKEAAATAE